MTEHVVPQKPDRKLQVLEEGDPHGRPIFWLHGTPGSRVTPAPFLRDAQAKKIRLIAYDRPGYGESTRHPGRTVAETGNEVAAIADYLGIDRFGVWGISGGGAPALACAATLPKRVVAVASLAGVAPYRTAGLDWFAGMGELNVTEFKLASTDRAAFEKLSRTERDQLVGATGDQIREMWSSLLSEVDRAAFTEEIADFMVRSSREGLKHGAEGMIDDAFSQVTPWGFELSSIQCPAQLWQGREDRFVPFGHGEWLAAHVPKAEAHLLENEGHLSLLRFVPEVHAWLLSKF